MISFIKAECGCGKTWYDYNSFLQHAEKVHAIAYGFKDQKNIYKRAYQKGYKAGTKTGKNMAVASANALSDVIEKFKEWEKITS